MLSGTRRLLFVDDEPIMRELYQDLQNDLGPGHEIRTASNAAEALKLMSSVKFDIVISDLTMPDMPGLDFLAHVMHSHPATARIVISGYAEPLKAAETLNVAHRYFRKPIDLPSFGSLLKRLCHYDYLLANDRIRRMIFLTGALPVLPETYLKITKLLNSAFSEIADIAAVVEQDPGLASKLLHTVNSAHFGVPRKV